MQHESNGTDTTYFETKYTSDLFQYIYRHLKLSVFKAPATSVCERGRTNEQAVSCGHPCANPVLVAGDGRDADDGDVDNSDVEGGDIDDYNYGWMCWK